MTLKEQLKKEFGYDTDALQRFVNENHEILNIEDENEKEIENDKKEENEN